MIGAIAGDMIGKIYEFNPIKTTDFPLWSIESTFTDDSVLTIALADCILHDKPYPVTMFEYVNRYPHAGYGGYFRRMIREGKVHPYNSFGNGAAMRISPVGFAYNSEGEVLSKAKHYTEVTHNHPEGIKGGQATALAVFMARTGSSKAKIKSEIENRFGYELDKTINEIRPHYWFDETCQGTVPQAITAFLEADSYVDAIRLAISLGGDADTLACIAGGIAGAFYGVPDDIQKEANSRLTDDLKIIVEKFEEKYPHKAIVQ